MRKSILGLAVLAVFGTTGLAAQSMGAGGNVPGAAVWGDVQALEFGTMTPGTETADRAIGLLSTTVDAEAGNAGWINVRLNKNGTTIAFTLPASLDGAIEGNALAINAWACGLKFGANAVTAPATPGTTGELDDYDATCADDLDVTGLPGARLVRIYLGGTILGSDIDSVLADDFTGEITLLATVP